MEKSQALTHHSVSGGRLLHLRCATLAARSAGLPRVPGLLGKGGAMVALRAALVLVSGSALLPRAAGKYASGTFHLDAGDPGC